MMMNRRNFLKVCNKFGLSYASLPLLGSLPSLAYAADTEFTQGRRFLAAYHPHGMHQPSWTCGEGDQQGNSWELSKVLSPLQSVKEKTIVLEGISRYGNQTADPHQHGMVGLLTGSELGAEGFSLDQLVADHWKTKALLLGVQSGTTLYNSRRAGYDNVTLSFRGNRAAGAQAVNNNPFSAFQQTFGSVAASGPYDSFATNQSVLDAVLEEVNSVKKVLNADDIHLLESHQQSIRDLECRLHGVYCSDEVSELPPVGACQAPALIAQPANLDAYLADQNNFPTIARLQADIAVAAIACSISPVVMLQHAATQSTHTYSWVTNEDGNPASSGEHHDLSHNIYSSTGAARDFNAIHTWYAQQISRIATQLDNIPEGDGTVLDNTLIYWGTCLGTPQLHKHQNWPSVVIGNAGGFFKTNQALDFRKNENGNCYTDPIRCYLDTISDTSTVDLLNTLAAALGLPATNSNAVVGNLTNEEDDSYVGNAYHGLIQKMMS